MQFAGTGLGIGAPARRWRDERVGREEVRRGRRGGRRRRAERSIFVFL